MVQNIHISNGTAHDTPIDMIKILTSKPIVRTLWNDITPLARNEWICWVESAKKKQTRERRIIIMVDKLMRGERRPCCWAGCTHR